MGIFIFDSTSGRLMECATARCVFQLEGETADVLYEKSYHAANRNLTWNEVAYATNTRACSCTSKAESPLSRPHDLTA